MIFLTKILAKTPLPFYTLPKRFNIIESAIFMANWFQKFLIGTALAGALSTPAAGQQNSPAGGDKKTDGTEQVVSSAQEKNAGPRIYVKTLEIGENDPIPGRFGSDVNGIIASYNSEYDRIVCINYHISDDVAYQKVDGDLRQKNLQTALQKFHDCLKKAKYDGKMPQNLAETEQTLAQAKQQLTAKKMDEVANTADFLGLTAAIGNKNDVAAVNRQNTDLTTIRHEYTHYLQDKREEAAGLQHGSLLPGSLLSPQDHLLAEMAKEMEAWCRSGESGCATDAESMKKFMDERAPKYLTKISKDIRSSGWFSRATYRHCYAQNLEIGFKQMSSTQVPIRFGTALTVYVGGKKYDVAQCINESDGSWCYTVPKDGTREHMPDGTIITAEDGKKYEANILYDKNGAPVKDANGQTIKAYGGYDDGWIISVYENTPVAGDDFSKKNLDKRLTVLFGEKSADNAFRALIDKALNELAQSTEYTELSFLNNDIKGKPDYIEECRENPLTDDYVRKGIDNNNARLQDDVSQYKDITTQVAARQKSADMRQALAATHGAEQPAVGGTERENATYDATAHFLGRQSGYDR